MTQAVCFKCGSLKLGAFSDCGSCGARPQSDDDLMLSLAFTDHYFDRASLERIGADVARGRGPQLDLTTREKLGPAVQEAKRLLGFGERSRQSAAPCTPRAIGAPKQSGILATAVISILLFAVAVMIVGAARDYLPESVGRSLDYVIIPVAVLWFLWSWFKWHARQRGDQNLLDVLAATVQEHESGRHNNTEYIKKQIAYIERNQKLTPEVERLLERARVAIL
jgi:hypothetical protein